jgi:hypothetical protein
MLGLGRRTEDKEWKKEGEKGGDEKEEQKSK